MKFTKILDGVNVQGYHVSKPSPAFKKLFPKRYVFSLDVFGEHVIINEDTIPRNFTLYPPVGYVFTYEKKLPNWLISEKIAYQDVGGCFPSCLDSYFMNTKDVDLIISCTPRNKVVPPRFSNEIIVQCNSEQLMKCNGVKGSASEAMKQNIMTIVNKYLREGDFSIEAWFRNVIFNYPFNNNGLPIRYPKTVSEKTVNVCSIKPDELFVEYDFRATSYEKEEGFIKTIEDAFEDMNKEVEIYEDYNGLLKTIRQQLDKKKLKYKVEKEDCIKVKAKFLRSLDLKVQLTSFI